MNFSPHASFRTFNPATQQALAQAIPDNIAAAQENLIQAIKNQNEDDFNDIIDIILSEGASINAPDKNGFIPLEIAVIENKPRIVQSLLSRGSMLPLVHTNGFDLVMLTASKGQTAILMVLLDVGCMLPDAQDDCGATPLHYAVINGQLQSAIALLDREADTDLVMTGDIDLSIRLTARLPDTVGKAGTTPLMLAVAMGNHALTELLLSRGASCVAGVRHPLEIAIMNDDIFMLNLLLEKNTDPNTVTLSGGRSLLTLSIENQCSTALIKKLIPFSLQTPAGLNALDAPLHTAIQTGQHDVVRHLLCQGAKIEADTDASASLWTLAENLNDARKMVNILIASRADHAIAMLKKNGMSLSFFLQYASQPSVISSHGIFPEAISSALPALQEMQSRSHELSLTQIKFEVAYHLSRLQVVEENSTTTNSPSAESILNGNDENSLKSDIQKKINDQIKELRNIGRVILGNYANYLSRAISLDFFRLMLETYTDRPDLGAFIQYKLTLEDGLPLPAAELIATAWVTSYEQAKQEIFFSAKNKMLLLRTEHQTMLMLENAILKKTNENQIVRDGRSFCLGALLHVARKRHTPMRQFMTDPVAFLRLLPRSLSEEKLTEQQFVELLSSTLGLPTPICRKIQQAWESANAEANIAVPSGHAGRVYDFLSQAMAASLKLMLHGPRNYRQDGENIMPSRLQGQLLHWCNTILAQQNEYEVDERDQRRPEKRARLNL